MLRNTSQVIPSTTTTAIEWDTIAGDALGVTVVGGVDVQWPSFGAADEYSVVWNQAKLSAATADEYNVAVSTVSLFPERYYARWSETLSSDEYLTIGAASIYQSGGGTNALILDLWQDKGSDITIDTGTMVITYMGQYQ